MFEVGQTAYFVFCGDWTNGQYNKHFCLPRVYYPFMPIKILECRDSSTNIIGMSCVVRLEPENLTGRWNLSIDCIEKEFSIEKFVLAQLEWGKLITKEQFGYIMSTVKGGVNE